MNETHIGIVIVSMVVLMLGALVGGLWTRRPSNENPRGKGIGRRFIQFVGLAWLIGTIVILAVASHIDKITVGTILGAVAGYLFGMGGRDEAQLRRVAQEIKRMRKHFTERES